MQEFLDSHILLAIFLILFLEDIGIPMPIPADFVVIFSGYRVHEHTLNPFLALLFIEVAVNAGSSVQYFIIRRGGRPLIDKYGRYVHLGQKELAWGERLIARWGWKGIVVGRMTPGIRLATTITCGILRVPYRVFLPAQMAGVSVYIVFYFVLGFIYGKNVAEYVRIPNISFHTIFILVVAIALPYLLGRVTRSMHLSESAEERFPLLLRLRHESLAGFLGAIELASAWTALLSIFSLFRFTRHFETSIRVDASTMSGWLIPSPVHKDAYFHYIIVYSLTLLLTVLLSIFYHELLEPLLQRLGMRRPIWNAAAFTLCAVIIAIALSFPSFPHNETAWRAAALPVIFALAISLFASSLVIMRAHALIEHLFDKDEENATVEETNLH